MLASLRDRRRGLLHDAGHVALGIGDHHAEALVVLHLLGPDDPVGIGPVDEREIGLEHGVDEDDQHRPLHVGARQVDGARGAVLHLLLDEPRRNLVLGPGKLLHLLLQVAGNEDQLGDVEALEPVHHPVHHRAAGHLEQRLGHQMGVRAAAGCPCPRAG